MGITVVATATAPARVDSIAFLRDGMRLGVLTGPSGVWTIHEAVLGEYKIRTVVYGTGAVNSPLASAELALLVYTGPTGPTP